MLSLLCKYFYHLFWLLVNFVFCCLLLLQCLRQHRGAAVTGATGVGKTETVKGLAYTLGRYLAMFGCSPNSDPVAMGKIVQGLAMVRFKCNFFKATFFKVSCLMLSLDHFASYIQKNKEKL